MPAGYFACVECGEFVVEGTQWSSTRHCSDCGTAQAREARDDSLAFEVEGQVHKLKTRPKIGANKGPRKVYGTPAQRTKIANARNAAIRRLIALDRPLYELLLAEERALVGLDPRIMVNGKTSTVSLDAAIEQRLELERTNLEIARAEAERDRV